jgi:CBS domain-containing protein
MSRGPVSVRVDTPVEEIVDLMHRHRVKRLPVVAEGKVVGIVSRANLLEALIGVHAQASKLTPSNPS